MSFADAIDAVRNKYLGALPPRLAPVQHERMPREERESETERELNPLLLPSLLLLRSMPVNQAEKETEKETETGKETETERDKDPLLQPQPAPLKLREFPREPSPLLLSDSDYDDSAGDGLDLNAAQPPLVVSGGDGSAAVLVPVPSPPPAVPLDRVPKSYVHHPDINSVCARLMAEKQYATAADYDREKTLITRRLYRRKRRLLKSFLTRDARHTRHEDIIQQCDEIMSRLPHLTEEERRTMRTRIYKRLYDRKVNNMVAPFWGKFQLAVV